MTFLRTWFDNQPIQKKLIFSNLLGTVFALIPIFLIIVTYEFFALRNHTLDAIRVEADIVSENIAAALAFHDETAAVETLDALRHADDIIKSSLFFNDGSPFVHYFRDHQSNLSKALDTPVSVSSEKITFFEITIIKPVSLRSKLVGSLILVGSLKNFYTHLMWYILLLIAAFSTGFYIAVMIAVWVSNMITEPLSSLTLATQKIINEGDYNTEISLSTNDEVGHLSRAFSDMMFQIHKRDLSLQQLAYYDRITAIPNRHYFEERITQTVENAKRYGTCCNLLMIDLDNFKMVNDLHGHYIGDLLLRHVSEQLQSTLRKSDTVFRIGGDEFAVIVENSASNEEVESIAKKIIKALCHSMMIEGIEIQIGASIGISCFPKHSVDVKTLMNTADAAMYQAKKEGKNRYRIFSNIA